MRYLPCKTCHTTALAQRGSPGPGLLHCIGTMHDSTLTYLCRRCGRNTTITSIEFAALPEMTTEEIAAPTCDITPE